MNPVERACRSSTPSLASRTVSSPRGLRKCPNIASTCGWKIGFFSHELKWVNLGYFALTGHQTIERAMESRTPTRPEPLALFGRFKQFVFSRRTTRKSSRIPSAITTRFGQIGRENRISTWKKVISVDADLRPLSWWYLESGCGSKSNRGQLASS